MALVEKICESIRAGVRPEIAAVLNGVPSRTYYEWMEKARNGDQRPTLIELQVGVELSLAEWEAADLLTVGSASRRDAPGDWKAAAWRLERRMPGTYGRQTNHKVQITDETILRSETWTEMAGRIIAALEPFPEALDAVILALNPGQTIEGEAVEIAMIEIGEIEA